MIPKKIHYFWFSGDPFPENIKRCMESWKIFMPDYEIIKWDLNNTPIEGAFAEKALAEKKWAFLSDYARLRILHEHGGVYLDTDVLVVKSFDELLNNASFWGRANNGMVEPVVIGSVKDHSTIAACLDIYTSKKNDLHFKEIPLEILPVFTELGFNIKSAKTQIVGENIIFSYDYFCPMPFEKADEENPYSFITKNTYAIHLWNAAWFDPFRFFWSGRRKKAWRAIRKKIISNPLQGWEFYKNVFYHMRKKNTL
jgi:mannosyltransferase OCH1-like enzyme